ncbi:hypothetical protein [Lacticaseibacillus saniviri]
MNDQLRAKIQDAQVQASAFSETWWHSLENDADYEPYTDADQHYLDQIFGKYDNVIDELVALLNGKEDEDED